MGNIYKRQADARGRWEIMVESEGNLLDEAEVLLKMENISKRWRNGRWALEQRGNLY